MWSDALRIEDLDNSLIDMSPFHIRWWISMWELVKNSMMANCDLKKIDTLKQVPPRSQFNNGRRFWRNWWKPPSIWTPNTRMKQKTQVNPYAPYSDYTYILDGGTFLASDGLFLFCSTKSFEKKKKKRKKYFQKISTKKFFLNFENPKNSERTIHNLYFSVTTFVSLNRSI